LDLTNGSTIIFFQDLPSGMKAYERVADLTVSLYQSFEQVTDP